MQLPAKHQRTRTQSTPNSTDIQVPKTATQTDQTLKKESYKHGIQATSRRAKKDTKETNAKNAENKTTHPSQYSASITTSSPRKKQKQHQQPQPKPKTARRNLTSKTHQPFPHNSYKLVPKLTNKIYIIMKPAPRGQNLGLIAT